MGPLGIGTCYQRQQMCDITVEKAFNMFMEYTHYNVDPWALELGVRFLLPGNSMGFAVNSGRIAGKEASAYVQRV